MHNKVAAYEGQNNYIFVSYAHKDGDKVFRIIEKLHDRGYRIWYDEGIVPGSEWPENIAMHLKNSAMVIAFISPNSMASVNCRREINFALSKQKPLLSAVLEPTELPPGMEMQLSAQQSVLRENFETEEQFIEKICACPEMDCCKQQNYSDMVEELPPVPCSPQQDIPDMVEHTEDPETEKQRLENAVSRYGNLTASVTSGVGALILIIVTALLFANYHQQNLANYTSFGQFPDWIADILPGVWHELPAITDPAYRSLGNLPATAWLIAAGWLLRSVGHTFQRHGAAKKTVLAADILRYAAIVAHVALCARVELAAQQRGAQWDAWLPYYFPVENLVVFVVMIIGGYITGRIINWCVRKILNMTLPVKL